MLHMVPGAACASASGCFATLPGPQGARPEPRTLREVLVYARQHAARVEVRHAERDRVRAQARWRGFWLPEAPAVGPNGRTASGRREGGSQDRVLEGGLTLEPFGQGIFRAAGGGGGAPARARRSGRAGARLGGGRRLELPRNKTFSF